MTNEKLQPAGAQGKGLARRDFIAGASLALVAVTAIGATARAEADRYVNHRHNPDIPVGAHDRCCSYDSNDSGLAFVTWEDAPLCEGDLVVVETRDESCAGFYAPAPNGCVKLEVEEEGQTVWRVFKPSEVRSVARVMHVEMCGRVLGWLPLAEGGAR